MYHLTGKRGRGGEGQAAETGGDGGVAKQQSVTDEESSSLKAYYLRYIVGLYWMKKRSEETQTLRDGCSKAKPKFFAPPQTPFAGARDSQTLISWRWSLPLPTYPVWWDRCTQFRVIVVTDHKHSHKPTYREPITMHCAAVSAQCIKHARVDDCSKPTPNV